MLRTGFDRLRELAAITAGLDDIDMADLVAQVRDIRGILTKRPPLTAQPDGRS